MDEPVDYKGDHSKPGLYYVECETKFPMRGNGWYSQAMIEYMKPTQIKYAIYASLSIKANHFNDLIDYLYSAMGDYGKLAVNAMIGSFKPKVRENWKSILITTDANNAFWHYLDKKANFIDSRMIGDKYYHQVYEQSLTTREETEAPIYNMVLDVEAIELHKLSSIIKEKKGEVLDLSTDCVTCVFPTNVCPFKLEIGSNNISGHYDSAEFRPKYKLEEKQSRLKQERLSGQNRTLKYEHSK